MEYRGGFTYPIKKGCESVNNADKIRSMSDEELAWLIVVRVIELQHPAMRELAYSAWLKWLQRPAEGE